MKSFDEIERTAPASRVHRKIKDFLERLATQGWAAALQIEAYRPGLEVIHVSWSEWHDEEQLLYRGPAGKWAINGRLFRDCNFEGTTEASLAACL